MHPAADEESIFAAAIEQRTPEERAALLDEACAGDTRLRARVEKLIWAHEHPDSFLEATSGQFSLDLPNTLDLEPFEEPGSEIGHYRLLERIGEGGMGVVYLAEQSKPVRRRVALKVIKPGLDTRQVVARFAAEQQALALMNHPNIAKVLDAGSTQTGRPYLVMEFVRGEPITEYCDREKLNTRQRLELFITVCQAVQHAHQKGVIHRDLKPSNVLVEVHDVLAVPKVIDFGVAKAIGQDLTDDFYHTALNQVIGTPMYMSPEQAGYSSLDVDTRSDIYSLGVLLYEMLTGDTPFARDQLREAGVDELRRLICDVDPLRPSARISTLKAAELETVSQRRGIEPSRLARHLRGELDWIVMKSLEKDRSRRYETAAAFARDVQRYLVDEPVEARPQNASYRLAKMLRRHKGPAVAAALVTLALVGGVIGTTLAMLDARQAWRAESARAKSESRERKRAELAEQATAEEAAVAKAVNQFIQEDLFGMASAEGQLHGALEPDPQVQVTTLLDRALSKVDQRFADQPQQRAAIKHSLGSAFQAIGRYEEAAKMFAQALGHCEQTLGSNSPDTLQVSCDLAVALGSADGFAKVLPRAEKTFEVCRNSLGHEHLITLNSMDILALACRHAGQHDRSVRLYLEELELRRRVMGSEHLTTLRTMNNLASAYWQAGKLDMSIPIFEETLLLLTKNMGTLHPQTIATTGNLALNYFQAGRRSDALPLLQLAYEKKLEVLGPEHPSTFATMNTLSVCYWESRRLDESIPLFEEALRLKTAKWGPDHPQTLMTRFNLGVNYVEAGRLNDGIDLLEHAYQQHRKSLGPTHTDTVETMRMLGVAYYSSKRLDRSIPLLEEALRIFTATQGPNSPKTLQTTKDLGVNYREAGRIEDAVRLCEEAFERQCETLGRDHRDTLSTMDGLAAAYESSGRTDEAIQLLEDALKLKKDKLGHDDLGTLVTMHILGNAYLRAGHVNDALPLLEHAFDRRYKILGPEHADTLQSKEALAVSYWHVDRLSQSIPMFEELLEIQRAKLPADDPRIFQSLTNLAVNYLDAGRIADAIEFFEKVYPQRKNPASGDHVATRLIQAYEQLSQHDKAEKIYRDEVELAREQFGSEHPRCGLQLCLLGDCLLKQKRWEEAEPILREGLAIREKAESDSWTTFNATALLGAALLGQQDYAAAEPLLLRGYEGMKERDEQIPPQGKLRLTEAMQRLIELYTAWEKPDEAAKWRAMLPIEPTKSIDN